MRELNGMGVELNSIEQPLDLSQPENKLLLAIYLVIPEVENDKNSSRTKDGMRRAKKDGYWVGSPPFGYSNTRDPNNKPTLTLNEKAALVHKAFLIVSKGIYSMEEARRQMNKAGMKLSKQAFINLLSNVAYTGRIYIPEYGKEQVIIVKGIHPPIIDDELWEQVQRIVSKRKRHQLITGNQNEMYPLRGHLICPKCGRNLTGGASKGRSKKYPYYNCTPSCGFRNPVDDAHNKFIRFLRSFQVKGEVASLYIEVMKEVFKNNEGMKADQIRLIEKQVADQEETKVKAFDKYVGNELSKEVWEEHTFRMERKIGELKIRKAELQSINSQGSMFIEYGMCLLRNLAKAYTEAPLEVKHKLLGSLFPSKIVFDKESYRTAKDNYLLSLIYSSFNGLRRSKNEKVGKNADLSSGAPPARLELATL